MRASRLQGLHLPVLAGMLFTLLVPAGAALASTTVPAGTISTDTTWTLAGAPYIVTGLVEIQGTDGPDGVTTLTIQPGVQVRFTVVQGGLRVGNAQPGALVADGDAAPPATIVFTSDKASPARGDWAGVRFGAQARATSLLRNARLEYGSSGSFFNGMLSVATGSGVTVTLDRLTLREASATTGGYALYAEAASLSLTASTITGNGGYGLYLATAGTIGVSGTTFGGNGNADVFVGSAAIGGTIQNCPAIESVFYSGSTATLAWTGNTFTNFGARTSRVNPDTAARLALDNTVTRTAGSVLEILGGTQARDGSWSLALADRLRLLGLVDVQGTDGPDGVTTLTIPPGREIRGGSTSAGLRVGNTAAGALVADGDAAPAATIVFTSDKAVPVRGDWAGVRFGAQARATSILRNARLEYGGSGISFIGMLGVGTGAGVAPLFDRLTLREAGGQYTVYDDAALLTLTNSTIQSNAGYGVYVTAVGTLTLTSVTLSGNGNYDVYLNNFAIAGTVQNGAFESLYYVGATPTVALTGNTVTNFGARTSRVPPDVAARLALDNTVTRTAGSVLEILGGTQARDGSWSLALADRLRLLGLVDVQGTDGPDGVTTLTIPPGREIRGGSTSAGLRIGNALPGALVADGDAAPAATIVFTSDKAVPVRGDWAGVRFGAQARATSILRNARLEYGGSGSSFIGMLGVGTGAGVAPLFDRLTLREAGGQYTVYDDAALLTLTNSTIQSNAGYGVYVTAVGTLTLTSVTLSGNGNYDVYLNNFAIAGTVQNSAFESLYYVGPTPTVALTGNTVTNFGARTSRVPPDVAARLALDNTVTKTAGSVLEILDGTQARDGSWSFALADRLRLLGLVDVQGTDGPDGVTTLTIPPGREVRFNTTVAGLRIGNTAAGALVADGDVAPAATIVFTSDKAGPARGDWAGVRFGTQARATSILRNARIEYAGSGSFFTGALAVGTAIGATPTLARLTLRENGTQPTSAGLYVDGAGVSLASSSITATTGYGIQVAAAGTLDVTGTRVSGNGNYDLYVLNLAVAGSFQGAPSIESVSFAGATPTLSLSGNVFDNWGARTSRLNPDTAARLVADNTVNRVAGARVQVNGGTQTVDGSWDPAAGTYELLGAITVRGTAGADGISTLTVRPGTVAQFATGTGLSAGGTTGAPGSLVVAAAGNAATFTSNQASPSIGAWTGVNVLATGRADLSGLNVNWAATGLAVSGLLNSADTVKVIRATTGYAFTNATFGGILAALYCSNVTTCIQSSNSAPVLRSGELVTNPGGFGVNNTTPATVVDARQNFWGATNGPGPVGPGSGSKVTAGVLYDPWLTVREDDGDPIVKDAGCGFPCPCTGGNTLNCDDNCPNVPNPSQKDVDGDGVGDACDSDPVLTVSSDAADVPDYPTVQQAVDAAFQSGTRVEIYGGFGPYRENVRVDRYQQFRFTAHVADPPAPVILDGGGGVALWMTNTVGTGPMLVDGLTIRGQTGVRSAVDTEIRNSTFEFGAATGSAIDFTAGVHHVSGATFAPTVNDGITIAAGAEARVERSRFDRLAGAAVVTAGKLTLDTSLLGGGRDGVRLSASTGQATLRYVTVANGTGRGIDNAAGGTVSVDRSILYGNAAGDVFNVACPAIGWSTVGSTNCSSVNDNLQANPLLDAAFRLQDASPCLDHGPDPATYDGTPAQDLDGNPRLLDFNRDGSARNDCGAFEKYAAGAVPGEVLNLRFAFNDVTLIWDAEPSAARYGIYRGDVAQLSYASYGSCRNDLDPVKTDTQLIDTGAPAPGASLFYLVSAVAANGKEGTLGFGTSAERSNFAPCP